MKTQPIIPMQDDLDAVTKIVYNLLAMGISADIICERLEIGRGEEHWWWRQRREFHKWGE